VIPGKSERLTHMVLQIVLITVAAALFLGRLTMIFLHDRPGKRGS